MLLCIYIRDISVQYLRKRKRVLNLCRKFHVACGTTFSRINHNGQICYNLMALYIKWHHSTSYGKISFNPLKGLHVNNGMCAIYIPKTCALYTSHKMHFNNFKTLQLYIWCFNPCYLTWKGIFFPVPAFADYFTSLLQHIVLTINSDLQFFI